MELLILADDHTGACDAASCFPRAGWPAWIYFDPSAWRPDDGVSAISFGCRSLPEEEAARKVASWFEGMDVQRACRRTMVKIDSTLAAGSGLFLRAVAKAARTERIVLTPANPAQGRVVLGGALYVRDTVTGIDVRDWARQFTAIRVESPDAASESDLDRIVTQTEHSALLCGSAGMAAALCRTLPPPAPGCHASLPLIDEVVVLCGSQQPVSLRQIAELTSAGLERVVIRQVDRESPLRVIAEWPSDWLNRGRAVVVIGGDTALAVADHFAIRRVRGLGELTAGVAVGETETGGILGTKPGGFGGAHTMVKAVQVLKGIV